MLAPAFDDDLRLAHRMEDFAVDQLVAQTGIERLDIAIIARAARRDIGGLRTNRRDPLLHNFGDELRAIV